MVEDTNRDVNFHKLFWKKAEPLFNLSKKTKVAATIMKMGSTGSPITMSIREMAKEFKVSADTIQTVLNYMIENDLIRRRGHRVIYTNPNAIFKGEHDARMYTSVTYGYIESGKKDDIDLETGEVL